MRLKVLVLGSSGMVGHAVALYLEQNESFEVYNLAHKKILNERTVLLDVTNLEQLNNYLNGPGFDIIINCIGILNANAERYKDKAIFLNSYLPHYLEYKYTGAKTKIIHISTDCVFSGRGGRYVETAFCDGGSTYDRTKTLGEIINEKDLTFRMSIIGPDISYDGIGLFNWFMKAKGEIEGYTNVLWTGVTNIELARAIEAAILTGLSGLYHLVPDEIISKFDLLNLFRTVFNRKDLTIRKNNENCFNKSLVNTRKDFIFKPVGYDAMVSDMKGWIERFRELYPHYVTEVV
jgi:dTDP-4-dehydrorhamnose reductase